MSDDDELTVGEAAAILRVSESTVRRSTTLRPVKRTLGRGDRRYLRADVDAELKRMQERAAGEG
jgi:hypothetical protein